MTDKFVCFKSDEISTDDCYLLNLNEILWVNYFIDKSDNDEGLIIVFKNADHSTFEVHGNQAKKIFDEIKKLLMVMI